MNKIIFLLSFLVLFGCKPKDEPEVIKDTHEVQTKDEKPEYLSWKKRVYLAEDIVIDSIDSKASNIVFDSFYKYVGENDGYVCGRINWIDSYSQKEVDNYYYIYMSFLDGKVSSHSNPMIFNAVQEYPMKKYKMFCSLN